MRHPQYDYILFNKYARFFVEQNSCICVACFRNYTRFSAKIGPDRAIHVPRWVKLSSSESNIERHCFICCKVHATHSLSQSSNDTIEIRSVGVEGVARPNEIVVVMKLIVGDLISDILRKGLILGLII